MMAIYFFPRHNFLYFLKFVSVGGWGKRSDARYDNRGGFTKIGYSGKVVQNKGDLEDGEHRKSCTHLVLSVSMVHPRELSRPNNGARAFRTFSKTVMVSMGAKL